MSSYQKLKEKLKARDQEIHKILTDKEYYIRESLAYNVKLELEKRAFFGGRPTGKVKGFTGLLSKLKKNADRL